MRFLALTLVGAFLASALLLGAPPVASHGVPAAPPSGPSSTSVPGMMSTGIHPQGQLVPTVQSIPKAPTDVKVTPYGATAAFVSWANPPGQLSADTVCYDTYQVVYELGGVSCSTYGVLDKAVVYGLSAFTNYYFTVFATNTTGIGLSSADVALYPTHIPPAPTHLVLSHFMSDREGNWQVNLSWTNPVGYLISQSNIFYSTVPLTSTFFSSETTVSGNVTTTTIDGLSAGTNYFFCVETVAVSGTSPPSASVSLKNAMTNVTGLRVTYTDHYNIGLHWNPVPNVDYYTIHTDTTALSPSYGYSSAVWNSYGDSTNTSGYVWNSLTSGTTYYIAVQPEGSTNYSNMIEASTTGATPPTLPAHPSGLKVTSYNATAVSLSWTEGAGANWVEVMYSTSQSAAPTVLNLSATSSTTVTGLTANTTYWFYVANQVNGNAATSLFTNMVTQATEYIPAPTNLKVVSYGPSDANLTWTLPATDSATGPIVSQGLLVYSGTPTVNLGATSFTIGASATSFEATGLAANFYCFILIENAYINSQSSSGVFQITNLAPTPGNLTVASFTYDSVTLSYTNPTLGNVSTLSDYIWYHNGASGYGYTQSSAFSAASGAQTATIGSLAANNSYYFCIEITTYESTGLCSPTVTIEENFSIAPTALTMTSFTSTSVSLSWSLASTAGITFTNVYYSTTMSAIGGTYSVNNLAGASTSTTVTGLTANSTYYFWVGTQNALGYSRISNMVTQETSLPVAPTSLHLISGTSTTATLGWTNPLQPATITSIQVWSIAAIGNGSIGGWGQVADAATITSTSITVSTTTGATTYWALLDANYLGQSPYSNEIELSGSTLVTQTLAPPTALTVTSAGINWLNVSWTRSGGTAAGYNIATASSATTPFNVGVGCTAWNTTYCNDTSVTPLQSEYYLYAQAWSMSNAFSVPSPGIVLYSTLPTTPTGFHVVAYTNYTTNLSWNPTTATEGYTIWISTSPATAYNSVTNAETPYWTVVDAGASTANYFLLAAKNPLGYSMTAGSVWTPGLVGNSPNYSPIVGPPVPTIPAVQYLGTTYVALSWLNTPNATTTEVIYGLTCSALTSHQNGTGPETMNITGLANGTTYCFEASANSSAYSAPLNVTTLQTAYLGTPYGLGVVSQTSRSIDLSWKNPSGTLTNATIWYGATCSTLHNPVTMGSATTSGAVTGLAPSTTYCFAVQVWDQSRGSPLSTPHLGSTIGLGGPGGGGIGTCQQKACGRPSSISSGPVVPFLVGFFILLGITAALAAATRENPKAKVRQLRRRSRP